MPGPAPRLFLVGGSWRAIARLDMERVGYPLKVLHGYEPPIPQLLETLSWIRAQDQAAMSAMTGTSTARLSLVPLASRVLAELIRRIEPERVAISAYGLREGLLYRQMPEAMRALDPLIEACRHMEAASARSPGFGDALYDWLLPLYAGRPARRAAADPGRLPAARRELAGASGLPGRALLRVGDPGQHRRRRPCRAGVPRAGAAQPLQGDRPGGGGGSATAGCCRRRAPPTRRCSAAPCGSGRCCRAPSTGVLEHAAIAARRTDGWC